MTTTLDGHGISIDLPAAWEGRLGVRRSPADTFDRETGVRPRSLAGALDRVAPAGNQGWSGERAQPLVHLANFPLPVDRGDFGSGAVDVMGSGGILVALIEYGAESAGTALFAEQGLPQPLPGQFDPNTLQRRISGQYGYQRFVTVAGRPFCVYIVIGSAAGLGPRTAQAREVLAGTRIESR
ncbi:hypothetical protein D1871_16885 [Nakamurella silvestris]|nr:hypothetical protein D1871_16885 [Nakamurella silvestris]